jgi:uncharacterized protein
MDDFLTKNLQCRLCAREFSSLSVRKSMQPILKTESDFCTIYERETPYFYTVFVCPGCGYAFNEAFTRKPGDHLRKKLVILPDFFSGKRGPSTAQLAYKRAIECARLQRESDLVLAGLYLHLAWIHRLKKEEAREKEALGQSLAYYLGAFEGPDPIDSSRVMYLIGELNRRLGNPKEAVIWYSRVANDKNCSQAMRHRSREAWQSLRD